MEVNCSDHKVSEADLSLCRATVYSALALGFRPPTAETLSRIIEPQNTAALTDAAGLLDADGKMDLVAAIEISASTGRAGVASVAASYRALFGHTARGGVPPYETEYGNEALFQQPQELGDLMGFYRAFGLAVKLDEHERADHISCECEFLSFLAMKEAYALEHDNREMLAETRKAEKLFLRDHLARFLPTFAANLTREDSSGFYGALALLSIRFIGAECARLGVVAGAPNLGLRPADDSRVPVACGNGPECAMMPGANSPEGAGSL